MLTRACVLWLGTGWSSAAWAATFYVDANVGDDGRSASDAQARATPWRTVSRALGETTLSSGDTVQVSAGTYGGNETFPLPLKDGVSLNGAGPTQTVITVPDGASAAFRADTSLATRTTVSGVGLTFGGSSQFSVDGFQFEGTSLNVSPTLRNVTVGPRFATAVRYSLAGSSVLGGALENVAFTGVDRGIDAHTRGADVTLRVEDSTISAASQAVTFDAAQNSFRFSPVVLRSNLTSTNATAVSVNITNATNVEYTPWLIGNKVRSEPATGDRGIDGRIAEVGRLTGSSVVGGNDVTSRREGVYWFLRQFTAGSGAVDAESRIVGNRVTAGIYGIRAGDDALVGYDGNFRIEVTGNEVATTGAGINMYAGLYASDIIGAATVSGNTVTSSGTGPFDFGVAMSLSGSSNAQSHDGRVSDNIIESVGPAAMILYQYGERPGFLMSGNTIVANSGAGLVIYESTSSSGFLAPDMGGGERQSRGMNAIYDNGGGGPFGAFDVVNQTQQPVWAHDDYWGTSDLAAIDSHVSDDDETAGAGALDFGTPLGAQPTSNANIDASWSLVTDIGEAGLSTGDTVRLSVNVTAAGDVGCAAPTVAITDAFDGATYLAGTAASDEGYPRWAAAGVPPLIALGWIPNGSTATATWDAVVDEDAACAPIGALVTVTCLPTLTDGTASATLPRAVTDWFTDVDGDSFGDALQQACAGAPAPTGTVADAGDCDDADPSVHPGATEIPDDGVDQDCDGGDATEGDADTDSDSDTDSDTDTDTDTDSPCAEDGGAAGGGGCCKKNADTECAWLVLPIIPLTLRRRRRR